jgi:hypothetical protein
VDIQARTRITRAVAKLDALLDAGIRSFLDLTETHELTGYESLLHVMAAARAVDVRYRRMSVVDRDVPTVEHMAAVLAHVTSEIDAGRPVRALLGRDRAHRHRGRLLARGAGGTDDGRGPAADCGVAQGHARPGAGLTGDEAAAPVRPPVARLTPVRAAEIARQFHLGRKRSSKPSSNGLIRRQPAHSGDDLAINIESGIRPHPAPATATQPLIAVNNR